MEENLVGYLLNALDPETHRAVEKYLGSHPEARSKLDHLRGAIEPLAADKEEPEPPSGLVFRTLALVAEYRCRPLPQAPAPPPAALSPSVERRWYRRPDLLIAASLLILVGGIGIPALHQWRVSSRQKECANNLRMFHEALSTYADQASHRDEFPCATGQPRRNVAGIFVPALRQAGVVPEGLTVRCAATGQTPPTPHSLDDLQAMSPDQYESAARDLGGCYAYTLGYMGPDGMTHLPLRRNLEQAALLPIMADRPGEDRHRNSPNHNGQNVLYIGGHVRYATTPNAGLDDDNIYLNKNDKVSPGVNQWDTVLGRSEDHLDLPGPNDE
jgi:prepilin-type processing-associated H-X9-DG protein